MMILIALILGGLVLAAFATVVFSIHRSESRNDLLNPAHGCADAFTRKLLGVHVEHPSAPASRADSASLLSAGRR